MQKQIADLRPRVIPTPAHMRPHEKIRIGYLSGDFHAHATVYLIAGLLEAHDRSRFQLTAISCGPADNASAERNRIAAATDAFLEIPPALTDSEAAKDLAEQGFDILVDLSGFTRRGRPMALACRPAPVQVNYLGFPGTLGDGFIDYILADRVVIPPGDERHYAEKVVRLPHSYQPNTPRTPATEPVSRAECGLPETGIVFCCFNNAFKLTPETFASWMRILRACEPSVLWLLVPPDVMVNLKQAAAAQGLSPGRLILAPNLPHDRHLARLALADLLLDSWPCGAHTTASDALFMGVPVLTCAGRTFASRVAASLLSAVGLSELVTDTPADYERQAIRLAQDPARLHALKAHLIRSRHEAPLFDIPGITRCVEYAYETMFERQQRGLPPQAFDVPDTAF